MQGIDVLSSSAGMDEYPLDKSHLQNAAKLKWISNQAIETIAASNNQTLKKIENFRSEGKSKSEAKQEFSALKHKYPFVGFVPCQAGDIEFAMFQANDDVVAWEYLWFGPDGYEKRMVLDWIQWCRTRNTVLDIGSYSGLMSILAAKANKSTVVHAFEPMERTVERAKINIRANVVAGRVKLHAKAASDIDGVCNINLYRDDNVLGTGNSIEAKAGIKTVENRQITCVQIDNYLSEIVPTIIKIDVEGHELACLKGMIATLNRSKPKIMIEIWEDTRNEVLKLLTDIGYSCEPYEQELSRVMNFRCIPRKF